MGQVGHEQRRGNGGGQVTMTRLEKNATTSYCRHVGSSLEALPSTSKFASSQNLINAVETGPLFGASSLETVTPPPGAQCK